VKAFAGTIAAVASAAVLLVPSGAAAQVQFDVMHSFAGGASDGASPQAALIQGTDGNFYGTTVRGGLFDEGTVFRMTPAGSVAVLHTFGHPCPGCTHGAGPEAELLQGIDGNFYGTTARGGTSGLGTVFRMTPDGTVTTLHSFLGVGGSDGASPVAGLFQTPDDNFYGTTPSGGTFNRGTVFRMTPAGSVTVLHSFAGGGTDGSEPTAALIRGSDDAFYGTTSTGGNANSIDGAGTVFRMTADGAVTILHAFVNGFGSRPLGALVQASDGNFYGTTQNIGGVTAGAGGTIFRLTLAGFTVMKSGAFGGGQNPTDGLIQGNDGRLYGTAPAGSAFSNGSVFQLTLSGTLTTVHDFTGADGRNPHGALLQAADGNFYGTTESGGASGGGTIFRVRLAPLGPMQNLRATIVAGPKVQLTWDGVAGAESYTVKRALSPGAETVLASGITGTSYLDADVANNTSYYYIVSAVTTLAESSSNEVSIRLGRIVPGDFDNDGRADLTVYRPSNVNGYVLQSHGSYSYANFLQFTWGAPADTPVPGDFDGDGQTDRAVYSDATGSWSIRASSEQYGTSTTYAWGAAGDIPLLADFDGDRRSDLAVYRPSNGMWLIRLSSVNYSETASVSYQWGLPGDTPVSGDFDGDGRTDLAVFRPATGEWLLRFSAAGYSYATWTSYQWGLPGDLPVSGDYDGDGKADLVVFRSSNGTWYLRFSASGFSYATATSLQWGLPGDTPVPNDYDADGRTDVAVWRATGPRTPQPSGPALAAGRWFILFSTSQYSYGAAASLQWGLEGDVPIARDTVALRAPADVHASVTPGVGVSLTWTVVPYAASYTIRRVSGNTETLIATGIPQTGYTDRSVVDGTTYRYTVSAVSTARESVHSGAVLVRVGPPVPADFDGDGLADLAVYRPSSGQWLVQPSQSQDDSGAALDFTWGLPDDVAIPGDFDGDGRTDLTVYRPSTGGWHVRFSSDQYSAATSASYQWGEAGDIPLLADFDGDRKSDLVIYRPASGTWLIRFSSNGYDPAASTSYQWGVAGDKPLAGDFDGDGRTDLAVFRPTSGEWFLRFSSDQFSYATWTSYGWGLPGDEPLVTDFDGDGRTDLAVYRPSNGNWYVRFSSSQFSHTTAAAYGWGLSGDVPAPNDFDGDGRTDIVVWRPSEGYWLMLLSSTGYDYGAWRIVPWGLPGDVPLAKK
jgi:uncharacterized repeat protein (TIGR03803 family)